MGKNHHELFEIRDSGPFWWIVKVNLQKGFLSQPRFPPQLEHSVVACTLALSAAHGSFVFPGTPDFLRVQLAGGGWGRLVCVLLPTPTPPQGFPLHFNSAAMHVRFLDFTSRFDFPYSDSVILAMTRSFVVRLWGHCGRGHFPPLVSQIGVLWLRAVTHGQKLTEFEGEREKAIFLGEDLISLSQ